MLSFGDGDGCIAWFIGCIDGVSVWETLLAQKFDRSARVAMLITVFLPNTGRYRTNSECCTNLDRVVSTTNDKHVIGFSTCTAKYPSTPNMAVNFRTSSYGRVRYLGTCLGTTIIVLEYYYFSIFNTTTSNLPQRYST